MPSALEYKIQNVRTPAHMMRFKSFNLEPIAVMIDGLKALDDEYGPGGTPSFPDFYALFDDEGSLIAKEMMDRVYKPEFQKKEEAA